MATEWKNPMKWENKGVEPSESLKKKGFSAGDKPPAALFNYFLNITGECIEEIQKNVAPNGFGLGDTATDISDKNLIEVTRGKSGFYRGANVTNAPNPYWWCYLVTSGVDTTDVIAFGSNGMIKTAHFFNADTTITWNEFSPASHTHTANSLGVPTLLTGTVIHENADLDSYIEAGNYCCGQSNTAGTLKNCPTYNAFTMKVFYANGSNYYIAQELTDYSTGVHYYRLYNKTSGTWQAWNATYNTANKPKASDIGSGELGGRVMANATSSANLSNSQVRNINAGTEDLSAGTSSLGSGCLYFVYE